MSNQNPIVVPMTQDERTRALAKTQDAIKYDEFVSLDNTKSINDEIMQMADADFSKMTNAFNTKNDFISAIFQMKRFLIRNSAVPDTLWKKVEQVRQDYKEYMNTIPRTPLIAPNATQPSSDEIARRKRKYDRLISLGVDPTLFSSDESEKENPYLVEAMVFINEDKDVPPKLLEKIKKYNQTEQ